MDAYKPYLPETGSKYLEANGHGRNFELIVNYVLSQLNLLDHENEYLKSKGKIINTVCKIIHIRHYYKYMGNKVH